MQPQLMTLPQTAEQLQIYPKTLVVLARRGDIASYRMGVGPKAPYRFSQEQVDAFLKSRLQPVRQAL